jgi:hypothetical protein
MDYLAKKILILSSHNGQEGKVEGDLAFPDLVFTR